MVKEYYLCITCKIAFKDLTGAVEHKINTTHTVAKVGFPPRHESFPPFKLERIVYLPEFEHLPEFVSSKPFPIGESVEPYTDEKYYACLNCRLAFRSKQGADEHRLNSRHKVVRVNYPLGPAYPTNFEHLEEVLGSNIDFDAFCSRVAQDIHEED